VRRSAQGFKNESGAQQMTEPDGQGDATLAFVRLGREVSLLRVAIEGLIAAQTSAAMPDYEPTLARTEKALAAVLRQIDAMSKSPALMLTPEELNRQIVEVGTTARSEDRRAIAAARQTIEEVATRLGRQLESHEIAYDQRRRRWQARREGSVAGLVAGILLCAILVGPIVRSLPTSWLLPERMAARTLRMPMWQGGQRMMRAASPGAFASIAASNRLVTANRDKLEACRKRAGKAGKAVRCTIEIGER
jgi:hypothetical protein